MIIFFLVATVVIAAGGIYWLNQPLSERPDERQFTIAAGESVTSVTIRMEEEGFIRSSLLLRIFSRVTGEDTHIPRGTFLLDASVSTYANYQRLLTHDEILQKVTIPEGWTLRKIADSLVQRDIILQAEEFIHAVQDSEVFASYGLPEIRNAEGFLFPDTYFFPLQVSPQVVVRHMVDNFFSQIENAGIAYADMDAKIFYDTVILSSIVEREYVFGDEAPLIASVFLNRLEDNMRLQSCATVVYMITEEYQEQHPTRLYYSDLERESDYNTYLHRGLPPAPIANAGLIALNAAFFPAESDYYFFVLRGYDANTHYFSRSVNEHYDAALLYLKKES